MLESGLDGYSLGVMMLEQDEQQDHPSLPSTFEFKSPVSPEGLGSVGLYGQLFCSPFPWACHSTWTQSQLWYWRLPYFLFSDGLVQLEAVDTETASQPCEKLTHRENWGHPTVCVATSAAEPVEPKSEKPPVEQAVLSTLACSSAEEHLWCWGLYMFQRDRLILPQLWCQ